MTDVTTELAKLTASTTELTNTVVGKYAALDSKVAAAGDSAADAATSEANAAQSVVDAQTVVDAASSELAAITAADRLATATNVTAAGAHVASAQKEKAAAEAARVGAETAEANAAAVVTGGTATTLSEAGKIPLANSEGKIDNAWIAGAAKCTKYDFEARRAQNNEKFAASGFVHMGTHQLGSTYGNVNEGIWTSQRAGYENIFVLGARSHDPGESKTNYPQINIAGVITNLENIGSGSDATLNFVRLPPAEGGNRTYDAATGTSVTHATPAIAFASETATNKVVTDRVDMWGFEMFLREISDADPFVYKNGLIQSQATNIDGVTTVTDNVRPDTYFAWYEGDESSRGKGVNWQTATESQRMAIASDPANNIYFDDGTGKFYQWCVRGRSFAGASNGDWEFIDSVGTNYLKCTPALGVKLQGIHDYVSPYSTSANSTYSAIATGSRSTANIFKQAGAFSSFYNGPSANGECYFLVCGTVNRLNKGAYHPSYNPTGTSKVWRNSAGHLSTWNMSDALVNRTECFDFSPNPTENKVVGGEGSIYFSGLGSAGSIPAGRPDGRLFNAIYASGQGGICRDMRYSAWGLKAEDFAEADLKVKSGEYRGKERLHRVQFLPEAYLGYWAAENPTHALFRTEPSNQGEIITLRAAGLNNGDPVLLKQANTGLTLYGRVSTSDGYIALGLDTSVLVLGHTMGLSSRDRSSPWYIMKLGLTESVAGEYTHTEVFGDPADILQCNDLKNGWVGSWNPAIPDGSNKRFTLHKKVIRDSYDRIYYSSNSGTSWGETFTVQNLDFVTNSIGHPTVFAEGNVCVYQYSAKANSTQVSLNSRVYGGARGIGDVYTTHLNHAKFGSLLTQSLLGDIATGNSDIGFATYRLSEYNLDTVSGVIFTAGKVYTPKHPNITLVGVTGVGVKALNYNVVENQQGFINYAYTELKHNGTDWGDDGKLHIVSNQAIMLDTNGNTVKVGTARIVEPLGWIKNDK